MIFFKLDIIETYNLKLNMKNLAIATLLLGASAHSTDSVEKEKYLKLTEGFLMGAIQAEGFTDLETCIQDGEHIINDAEKAFQDFEKKTVNGIIDGVKDIADAMKYIQAAMKDCKSAKGDWDKLEHIAIAFKNPVSFSWHIAGDIIHNGVKITHEIETGIEDYKKADWYGTGLNFGEAAAHVFLGLETQEAIVQGEKTAQFIQGYG